MTIGMASWTMAFRGCATQRTLPPPDDRAISIGASQGASEASIRRGYQLLVTDCRYCHMPVPPDSISMERWDKALPRMIKKARLSSQDEADIRAYVTASREASPPDAGRAR